MTRRGRARSRRGFTLIEMIIVLVIIGILGAVVVPAMMRPRPVDPVGFAAPVTSVLRTAQRLAVDSGSMVQLVIDPETSRFAAMRLGSVGIHEGTIALNSGDRLSTDSLRATFYFERSGIARGDTLYLSSGNRSAVITVDAWTGEAVVRAY